MTVAPMSGNSASRKLGKMPARPAAKAKDHLSIHDLRDSGCIENDAAAVILVDRVRRQDGPIYSGSELVRYLQILIGKNRYGVTTDPEQPLELAWWPRTCRIEDPARTPVEGAA